MKRKEPKYRYKYVMLLDDNDLDNFINQSMIDASHFASKIYTSTGSTSALEFLNNLAISDEKFELFPEIIFIDINMPMMDGFQFIEHLKKKLPERSERFKLVILTSSINERDRIKAEQMSRDIVFLNKPLTEDMLSQL